MRSPRYTILIANRRTGTVRRLTITRRPAALALLGLLAVPVLLGLGARWSALDEIGALTTATDALRIENNSYRAATGELAAQISSLQSAMAEISEQAELDPALRKAIDSLPAMVRNRAMGGGAIDTAAGFPPVNSEVVASPESTFGILRGLLASLETRLQSVRSGVESRQALASATPSIWPISTGWWLSSGFGRRADPFTGQPDFHAGLDISANRGTAVLATADGTVE